MWATPPEKKGGGGVQNIKQPTDDDDELVPIFALRKSVAVLMMSEGR